MWLYANYFRIRTFGGRNWFEGASDREGWMHNSGFKGFLGPRSERPESNFGRGNTSGQPGSERGLRSPGRARTRGAGGAGASPSAWLGWRGEP